MKHIPCPIDSVVWSMEDVQWPTKLFQDGKQHIFRGSWNLLYNVSDMFYQSYKMFYAPWTTFGTITSKIIATGWSSFQIGCGRSKLCVKYSVNVCTVKPSLFQSFFLHLLSMTDCHLNIVSYLKHGLYDNSWDCHAKLSPYNRCLLECLLQCLRFQNFN